MRNAMYVACFTTLLTTNILSAAYVAEEQKKLTSLDTVTVYATHSPLSIFDIPAMVSKVDTNAASSALACNVGGLLKYIPGVEMSFGPRRNVQKIFIRGFNDKQIITLIDHRRQNYESVHNGRFFVDPSLLKSIEIVKGSNSAIYGGGAIIGVAAFETKDAADLLTTEEKFGSNISVGYNSANKELFASITNYGQIHGWDLLSNLSYRDSDDINQGNGNKLDTEDHIISGLFKAGYTFGSFHKLKFQAQLLNNKGKEPNNGSGKKSLRNPIVNKKIQDKQVSLKYTFNNPENKWLNPKIHVYYNDTAVEKTDITGRNTGRVQVRKLNTLGFTVDNQTKITLSDMQNHIFSYGFEIYNDKQIGTNSVLQKRAGVPNAKAINYGVYLQDEIALNTTVGNFLIIPAVRFDQYSSKDENGNSNDENNISPKFSLSYKPIKQIMFFGSWAQAFRAPNLTELYPSGLHFPGMKNIMKDNYFVPNKELKPETITTFELGAGLKFDNVLANKDKATIKGSWFTSNSKDFISYDVNIKKGTTQNLNVPKAKMTGWEIETQYNLYPVTTKFGLSYSKAINNNTNNYLSAGLPLTLVTDISYKIDSIDSLVGWRGRFASVNEHVGIHNKIKAGYGVHDLYYRWTPDNKNLESLTVDVGINNIFDKAYIKYFAEMFEEGRSFVIKVSYKW